MDRRHRIILVPIVYAHIRWLIVTVFRHWFRWKIVTNSQISAASPASKKDLQNPVKPTS